MKNEKIYTSKSGRKFGISTVFRPGHDDVVYFLEEEFIWIKQRGLSPQEFECLWLLKREDYTYFCIPESDFQNAKDLANNYVPGIMKEIRRRM